MAKFGEGHAEAFVRAGFKEISQALQAFPGEGIQQIQEPGLVGCPTPQLVTQEMGGIEGYNQMLDAAASRGAGVEQELDKGMSR